LKNLLSSVDSTTDVPVTFSVTAGNGLELLDFRRPPKQEKFKYDDKLQVYCLPKSSLNIKTYFKNDKNNFRDCFSKQEQQRMKDFSISALSSLKSLMPSDFLCFFFFRIRHLTAESAEVDLLRGNFRRSPVLAENSGSNDRPAGEWEQDVNVLVEINVALKFNNNDNLMSVYTCVCALHCAPVAGNNNILKRSENFL
jgi:hypothetical protein